MTVTTTAASQIFQGNGVTTTFSYTFLIPSSTGSTTDQTWCTLTYTDANGNQTILASNLWSITGVGSQAGGTVTYIPAIATGTTVTLQRVLPYTQLTNLTNQAPFNASTIMGMDDYVTMLVQQILQAQQKSIQFPAVDVSTLNAILPAAAARAGLVLSFDGNGNVVASAGIAGPQGPAGSTFPIAAAGGTADAITATYSPALTLADQTLCALMASAANATTTPTFSPNSLSAKTITKRGGVALLPGDIPNALAVIFLEYNIAHTRWELLNPATTQDPWVAAGGTSDAITATYSPSIVALTDGLTLQFRASASNVTTTPTFSPNALTAYTITKKGGNPLASGDIPGQYAECIVAYNAANTRWELLNPASSAATGGGIVLLSTVNASSTSTVSFNNTYITNAYNKYQIEFDGVFASTGTILNLQVSSNNGGVWVTSYKYAGTAQAINSSSVLGFNGTGTTMDLLGGQGSIGATSTAPGAGTIKFSNPSLNADQTFFVQNYNNGAIFIFTSIVSHTSFNSIQIYPTTGTITGNFHLMGISGS